MTGIAVPIELNPALDIPALKAAFAETGRLHIPAILKPESAEAIAAVLETERHWHLSAAAGGQFMEMPLDGDRAAEPSKQSWIDDIRVDGSSPITQYIFDTRRLSTRDLEPERVHDAADHAFDFLNSQPFLDFIHAVTGDDRPSFADAQATRYRPGHVLTVHNDHSAGKHRLYAYVLSLTRDWRADFGGNLIFPGETGMIDDGYVPAFNALNLFRVPMRHAVTQVATFAPRHRLSIVGWLRWRPEDANAPE